MTRTSPIQRLGRAARPATRPVEVKARRLRKSFGEHAVLRGVSLDIFRGQIVAVVGASGSGKTVLLDILTGLVKPDSGTVMVGDHSREGCPLVDLNAIDEEEVDEVRLHWSVVFQRNALFSGTVGDNIALWFREHTELSEEEINRRVRESLEAATLDVDDVISKNRDELSGGMAKRVAIARAIAIDPAVVFYDEPTTGLDPMISAQIHELIFNLHNRPVGRGGGARTSVIVTHDKELLRRLAPRVIMLHEAKICFDGPYEKFGGPDCPPAEEYLRAMPVLHERSTDGGRGPA